MTKYWQECNINPLKLNPFNQEFAKALDFYSCNMCPADNLMSVDFNRPRKTLDKDVFSSESLSSSMLLCYNRKPEYLNLILYRD